MPEGTRLFLLAPVVRGRKGEYRKEMAEFQKKGFQRLKIDGEFFPIDEVPTLDKKLKHDLSVVVDRIVVRPDIATRLAESFRDRAGPRRRHRPGRAGRSGRGAGPGDHLLLEIRLPRLGLHHRRDRAAPLLLQQSLRRLPRLRGARVTADGRPRTRRARRPGDAEARGDRALGEIHLALLRPDPGGARRALRLQARHKMGEAPRGCPQRHPVRLGRSGDPLRIRRRGAGVSREQDVRGRGHQPRTAFQGDRERICPRGDRPLHGGFALCRLRRRPAETRGARGEGRYAHGQRGLHPADPRLSRLGDHPAPKNSTASGTRSPRASSRRSATG